MARGRAPGPRDGPAHRRPREPGGGGTAGGGARAPPRVHRARERRRQPRQAAEGGAALSRRPPRPPGRSARVISPVRWDGSRLALLDQTRLPVEEVEKPCASWQEVADAIRTLVVRGAPAIGVAAAFGVALAARQSRAEDWEDLLADLDGALKGLAATRPTAVNLFWALDRMRRTVLAGHAEPLSSLRGRLLAEAQAILAEDVAANRALGDHGAELVAPGARILTHCNAGALATAGYGTALGVIRSAHAQGKVALVWVDETRPVMQGSRLTAWECDREGIPHRLIADVAT